MVRQWPKCSAPGRSAQEHANILPPPPKHSDTGSSCTDVGGVLPLCSHWLSKRLEKWAASALSRKFGPNRVSFGARLSFLWHSLMTSLITKKMWLFGQTPQEWPEATARPIQTGHLARLRDSFKFSLYLGTISGSKSTVAPKKAKN